jgi:hypothetical protein
MKNTTVIILTLLLLTGSAANAQSKKYKTEGTKCQRVEIIETGAIFSTYDLNDGEIEMLTISGVKPALLDKIKATHKEDTWPAAFGNLEQRIANPDKIKSYVVYKVATIEDKVILVAPFKFNKDKESGWALTKDIFIVMYSTGIKE